MSELVERIRERLRGDGPWLIGVAGAVAVGKTTIAAQIAAETGAAVISTDAFLYPNAILAARDLVLRKGFPESYDEDAIVDALDTLANREQVSIPVYSHSAYDILETERQVVEGDVIVIEGVVALQDPFRSFLDVAVYVDADEAAVRQWFITRFLTWAAAAKDDPGSFYHGFSSLEPDAVRQIAELTWDGINAINLHEHIEPSRDVADLVVLKAADHTLINVTTIGR